MEIEDLVMTAHGNARAKGFYEGFVPTNEAVLAKLMLIVSEVAEACEDVRENKMTTTTLPSGKPVGFPSELADIVIRVCDLAGALGIDLDDEIVKKINYNLKRPHKHGKTC